ncbi:sulfate adenylyltransferase [Desulfolithobacter dissulfuricans]|uniref:Sulfate adenylyltransferase n=1 Tax=Desulfolithobacter dissulfuricans TaxID=2795293 RepID=A0A915TYV0_9BACT|nr:transglutaminase-like cysteine peptidase [Desulfolithobacter dissulfuricans]BCO07740.1 sulfate adenylyltransferase [Desulfolithobacter dissulfuricans]
MTPWRHATALILLLLATTLQGISPSLALSDRFSLDTSVLEAARHQYGREAGKRLRQWVELINHDTSRSTWEKLEKVNDFFNRLDFVDDTIHWKKQDYWATPVEFLASGGGDCEDFAMAKYFTLRALGIPDRQLTLTYVKALRYNLAHMVVTYYPAPGSEPLILDNLDKTIKPASRRRDLLPVYSFNGTGLWLAKQRGQGRFVGPSDRLSRWQDVLTRLPKGLF